MAQTSNKTQPVETKPEDFIATVEHPTRRQDAETLLSVFSAVTGLEPVLWNGSIIGYGRYAYKYESGREGEFLMTGFSPRKQNLSIHILPGYRYPQMQDLLMRLGKHKTGKSCLYINKLADVDMSVLEAIILDGVSYMRDNYQTWDR